MLMLTVQDIFDRVYRQLRADGADPVHWDDDELLTYLNDMLIDVAERAQCFKITRGIEISEKQRRYVLPRDILVPTRIEYDGEFLEEVSVEDLDNTDRTWRVRSGTPYVWFVELAPAGSIDLYRIPDSDGDIAALSADYGVVTAISDGTNTYTFSSDYGVVIALESDGDELFELNSDYGLITDWFSDVDNLTVTGYGYPNSVDSANETLPRPLHGNHPIAEAYLEYRCYMKDGKNQDLEKAKMFQAMYMELVNTVKTKPKTSTRRRFVKRTHDPEVVRTIGPAVPSVIS